MIGQWTLDPVLLAALALILAAGCAATAGSADRRRRFAWGWALAVILFVSPLCAWSSALFSVRVVHHLVLTGLVAPLLAWAAPARQPGRPAGGLFAWAAAHIALMWIWHAPPAYAAALSHDGLFWAMQLSLLGSAVRFWHATREAPLPAAIGVLVLAMFGTGMLGAIIALAGQPLYAPHLASTAAWGLTPLADQQLAGLIMWAPGALPYPVVALWRLARELRALPPAPALRRRRPSPVHRGAGQ